MIKTKNWFKKHEILMQNDKLEMLHKKVALEKDKISSNKSTNKYEQLFEGMGVIDTSKGHWVDLISINDNPCYKLIKFQLSDSLSYQDFKKHTEFIREKIRVGYLEIGEEKSVMTFMIIKDDLPTVKYKYFKTEKHLIPMGINLDNEIEYWDIINSPHQLVTGATNSGKSTMVDMEIIHIEENKSGYLYLIDLKDGVEFYDFRNMKSVKEFAYTNEGAKRVIKHFKEEAESRFTFLRENGYKNYNTYLKKNPDTDMKREFLVIDECGDLLVLNEKTTTKGEKKHGFDVIEELTMLGRKCRAVGLHLIISTQRPTADNLKPTLRAQLTNIVGFRQVNQQNSRNVIDENGLEELDNRECICLNQGNKFQFRTMFLEEEYMLKLIEKNNIPEKDRIEADKKRVSSIDDVYEDEE